MFNIPKQDQPVFFALLILIVSILLLPIVAQVDFIQKTLHDPLVLFTAVLAVFTIVLAIVSVRQIALTRQSIELARQEFEITHRPWISVQVLISNEGFWCRDGGANIGFNFVCTNTGNSPALDVGIVGEVKLTGYRNWLNQLEAICKKRQSGDLRGIFGTTIFPGETRTLGLTFGLGRWPFGSEIPGEYDLCSPAIVGAISYRFPFGESQIHLTRFIYEVGKFGGGHSLAFSPASGDLSADKLVLRPYHQGEAFTAD